MAFDAERYDREVIKPLRGQHGRLPPGNLAARYAVEPGWTAQDLVRHLAVVRRFWQDRAVGPDSRAEICRLLIRADEELIRTAGELMNDPAWWQEHGAAPPGTSPRQVRNRIRDEVSAARTTMPTERGPDQTSVWGGERPVDPSWRAEARAFILARLDGPAGAAASAPPVRTAGAEGGDTGAAATAGAAASGQRATDSPEFVPELTVTALGARGDQCRVRVSWRDAGPAQVRIRRCATPPPWRAKTPLSRAEMEAFGAELTGSREESDGEVRLIAEVPVGYHLYVPFLIDRERVTMGRFVALGIAEPVRRLLAERRGDDVVVTWIWPHGARYAVVEWATSDATSRHEVSRSAYASGNGFRIPAVTRPTVARVTVVSDVVGDEARSAAREVVLPPRPVAVSYTLNRQPLWYVRRRLTVRIRADAELTGVTVTVVLGAEPTLPEDAEQGTVLAESGPLDLRAGEPHDLEVIVPALPRRGHPYWIRCFVRGPVPTVVALPAVESMKVT
ncbi:hypothetical protein [Micromonospora sp. NPDC005305]|uniref:hypothetical protein n=1 Tax=Micromonospora sp. NPDC005305 TaxID=3156875 RepID=UPI0033B074D6